MCCRIQFCMIHGGLPAIFSVIESSEEKFPALEGFVLPTYFPSRLGNLTRSAWTDSGWVVIKGSRVCRKGRLSVGAVAASFRR